MDPSAFLEYGDGILVPGNRNLHKDEKDLRASALYWPYHVAIGEQVDRLVRRQLGLGNLLGNLVHGDDAEADP